MGEFFFILMMVHRESIKKNIEDVISFQFMFQTLSCRQYIFDIWIKKSKLYKFKIHFLILYDRILAKCHYEWIGGKKCLIYKSILNGRL